ncbi:MarR family transcriptional regulator [Streptomyces sp. NPDC013178]|uniref:MarR family winged helix-turn-helix transcriptional regulator n=1 Tax=Streptomyces sp. NPDC013178 TaxID=3155118 RepID=UPI00340F0851
MSREQSLEPAEWDAWHQFMRAYDDLCRELERELQHGFGISKADFSLLAALEAAPSGRLRVGELADALGWDKSRVAHQVSRMETRDLVEPIQGPSGRRTGVTLTSSGRSVLETSRIGHGSNVRRLFFDSLTPPEREALHTWSKHTIRRIGRLRDHDIRPPAAP